LDSLWDKKIGSTSFTHPYIRVIFEEGLHEEIDGVNVALPEVILSMKFLIEKTNTEAKNR